MGTAWSKEGRHALLQTLGTGEGSQLSASPVEGGVPLPAGISGVIVGGSTLSPDNRRIAFLGAQPPTDLRVFRNLLLESPK